MPALRSLPTSSGCGSRRGLDHDIIDVAPGPILARLEGPHQRVTDEARVRRGVPIRGRIAATDVAAREAEAQVHPRGADAEAVLATLRRRPDPPDLIEVGAWRRAMARRIRPGWHDRASARAFGAARFGEVQLNLRAGRCPLTHRRRHALDRSVAHVTDREDARHRRFERQTNLPGTINGGRVLARQDETTFVTGDARRQPLRSRLCADQNEQASCLAFGDRPSRRGRGP